MTNPTLTPDLGGTTLINGVPAFITHAGQSLTFGVRVQDPGSDDETVTWSWDDGPPAPDVSTTYLVNGLGPDPLKSPSIRPRDLIDTQLHTFGSACLYSVAIAADDDDGGTTSSTVKVIITGNATKNRSAGYWQTQYRLTSGSKFTQEQLSCYLKITAFMSRVFNERTDASTLALARAVLAPPTTKTTAEQQLDRQLLAVWLNFANGSIDLTSPVDANGDGVNDSTFAAALAAAEAVRLDPAATKAQKTILERINLRDGG